MHHRVNACHCCNCDRLSYCSLTFAAPPTSSLKSAVSEKYCLLWVSRAAVASWPCRRQQIQLSCSHYS
jgi:hypothetical protein